MSNGYIAVLSARKKRQKEDKDLKLEHDFLTVNLLEVVQNYKLFIDTCSVMHPNISAFLLEQLAPSLKRSQTKLIVPQRVAQELQKHGTSSYASEAKRLALNGIKSLHSLAESGMIDLRGDDQDTFADNVFLSVFTQYRMKYNLALITQDTSLAVDVDALNASHSVRLDKKIRVFRLTESGHLQEWNIERAKRTLELRQQRAASAEIKKFRLATRPRPTADQPLQVTSLPSEGGEVVSRQYGRVRLLSRLASGGEGVIYATDKPNIVCKVYFPEKLTVLRQQKIELMLREALDHPGICWPKDVVSFQGKFVGYLMDKAEGRPMQTAMFIKPVLQKNFPHWRRRHLVELAISILEKIDYLHKRNIIIGDINPLNILIKSEKEVYLVDTDSCQIEDFPCTVGTVNFTAPEIQGKDYKDFLRSFDHEHFAVATLVFMMLLPGKPPYSTQGGGSPGENIKGKDFSYPVGDKSNRKTPDGPWKFIWSNLPFRLKQTFYSVFKEDNRIPTEAWLQILNDYRGMIELGHASDELFPTHRKIIDPVSVTCSRCGESEVQEKRFIENLLAKGHNFICEDCREKIRIEKEEITVFCSQCGVEESATRRWLATLRSQGKQYVCTDCREAWKAGRSRSTMQPARTGASSLAPRQRVTPSAGARPSTASRPTPAGRTIKPKQQETLLQSLARLLFGK